jgi:hypothetical protein
MKFTFEQNEEVVLPIARHIGAPGYLEVLAISSTRFKNRGPGTDWRSVFVIYLPEMQP